MKKVRSRAWSMLLVLAMLLTVLPVGVQADSSHTPNNELGISYSFEKALRNALDSGKVGIEADETLTIEACQKLTGDLDLSNQGITEISDGAIAYTAKDALPEAEQKRCVGTVWAVSNLARALNNVTSLDLSGNSFLAVPSCFLMGSPSIQKVVLPDTVEVIGLTPSAGGTVFTDSKDGKYAWGYNAFSHMKKLTSVNIPDSVKYLADYSFAESVQLVYNIEDLPEGLIATGRKVFDMHESIRNTQEIMYGETHITGDIVKYLKKNPDVQFQDFVFEATEVYADAEELVALNYPGTFQGAFGVTNVTGNLVIPEGTTVSNYCFDRWQITGATVPASVTLGESSFTNNDQLESITVRYNGKDIPSFVEDLPDGVTVIYEIVPEADTAIDLAAALEAAKDGDTIILGADITLTGPLPGAAISGKELTIVGNNHTISFDQSQTYNAVFGNNNAPLYAGTKLTVKNVKFENTGDQGGYASIVGYDANGSAITYEGCTFENLYAAVYVNPVRNDPENGVAVSITGCEYSKTQYGYAIDQISEDGIWNVVDVTFENNEGDFQENEPLRNMVIAAVDGVERFYKTIQAAVNAADDGSVITVAPGTYNETVVFNGKSVTLKGANAGMNPNDPEEERGEESVFTGTMSTSGKAFEADQTVVIDGFKFTGDGLKVGDANWNKVGNLTVRNCLMETGGNLPANTSGMNNAWNYFVKVSGGHDNDYANVVIRDNLVTGKAVENVYPIQAWNVQTAEITGNVIRLTGAENHQAINVTKPAADAEITVSGNTIDGVGSGVYVTTATKDGDDFTGIVRVSDNVLTDADEPFYIGWESEEHGNFAGMLVAGGNTNNEKPVEVTAHTKPGAPEVKCLTATFMNENGDEYGSITIPLSFDDDDDPDSVTFPLRAPEDIPDGFTFTGWKSKNTGRIYDPENVHELTIKQDTVFVAQWEETDDGDGDGDGGDKPSGGSSSDDSSVGSPLPTVPTDPGDPTDPTDPSAPSGFVSDTTDDLTVNGTYQFRITSLDGTIPFLTVDNANFRVEFASQEGNDFFFKIHAQGAAGSTTVVSVNGVRLLTAIVGGSAAGVISDTTAPFTVKKGETYQFRLTASERPSFAAGSASFTVEYAGQIGSDYFYKVYAAGNAGDGCGFYINGEASPVAVATIA